MNTYAVVALRVTACSLEAYRFRCPPCRAFTPQLAKWYAGIKMLGCNQCNRDSRTCFNLSCVLYAVAHGGYAPSTFSCPDSRLLQTVAPTENRAVLRSELGDKFEIIFCSGDRDEASMKEYYKEQREAGGPASCNKDNRSSGCQDVVHTAALRFVRVRTSKPGTF